uniref:CHK kinase-like domain-containing protein n=1 Tax=Graphocephala atropunctata TaxID=36148 RepID=A0A1B6KJH2_9HEMI
MSRVRNLTDRTLPWVATSGRLGEGVVKFVKCVLDDGTSGEAQFASTVCFLVAVFDGDDGPLEQPMVVKFNMDDELTRNWLHLNEQFRNEVLVYEKVLPFLDRDKRINNIFPRYFYGYASESEDPSKYTIILEDLRKSGYKLSPEFIDLDFAHCALAFKKLGAFHALSFAAKQSNLKGFTDIVESLIESRLFEHNWEDADYLYSGSVDRAAGPLLKNGEKVAEINNFKNKLKNSYVYFKNLLTVNEPMGVICHGDFCRNNVLYKYDNGSPIDIKFFDLATARYGSPMLDFTFFFFLNCSEKSRKLNRDEFLQIYHHALSTSIPGLQVPSLEDFKEEFRQKAVYGFLICSFFKPALMDPVPFDPVKESRNSVEVRGRRVLHNGGEKATEVISNMLRELIELKYEL